MLDRKSGGRVEGGRRLLSRAPRSLRGDSRAGGEFIEHRGAIANVELAACSALAIDAANPYNSPAAALSRQASAVRT